MYDYNGVYKRVIAIDFIWQEVADRLNTPNYYYNLFVFLTTDLGTIVSIPEIWEDVVTESLIYT